MAGKLAKCIKTRKTHCDKDKQLKLIKERGENMAEKINVLGVEYSIEYHNIQEDKKLDDNEAYTDLVRKLIVMSNTEQREAFKDEPKEKIRKIQNKVLRHEIIHAFLYESGLCENSNRSYAWSENEEMVDWFAIQSPKIFKVFKELNIL